MANHEAISIQYRNMRELDILKGVGIDPRPVVCYQLHPLIQYEMGQANARGRVLVLHEHINCDELVLGVVGKPVVKSRAGNIVQPGVIGKINKTF